MNIEKLYFENEDAETCQPLKYFFQEADEEGLSKITLNPAVREKGKSNFFWCSEIGLCGEKGDLGCGKECRFYKPRNGKSGICAHSQKPYFHADEVTFVKTNNIWEKEV